MKSVPFLAALLMCALGSRATDFGTKGDPEPAKFDELATFPRQDSYDLPSAPSQAVMPR